MTAVREPAEASDTVDVDETVSAVSSALTQLPATSVSVAIVVSTAIATISAACTAAVLGSPAVAAALLAAGIGWASAPAIRERHRRRLWARIESFDVAEFAVATVWLARVRHTLRPARAAAARLSKLADDRIEACDDGAGVRHFVEMMCVDGVRLRPAADERVRRMRPLAPQLPRRRHPYDTYSRAELDAVAVIAASPSRRQLWRHCAPSIQFSTQSCVASEVVGATFATSPAVLEVAAGLAAGSHDSYTVLEALELAELVLAAPADR